MSATTWNSLELAKLGVALLTPILLFVLGLAVTRGARRVEQAQWAGRKLIERRLELHGQMAPPLNDLLCFFTWVGHFREIDPPKAVERKRRLDKVFFTNEQLFSDSFRDAYAHYIDTLFDHSGGAGADARLRTSPTRLRAERGTSSKWDPQWNDLFADEGERKPSHEALAAYRSLMDTFADELGVRPTGG